MTAPDSDSDSEAEVQHNMTNQSNRPDRAKDHIEQLEWIIHIFFEAIRKPCINIKRIATYLMVDRNGYKAIDEAVQWVIRNPFSSLALFIISLILLPFLLIIGFGIGIVIVSLTGFLVFEGTLLTFISVLSFGSLGALVIVLTLLSAIILSVYMGFAHIYDMYGSGKIAALTDYLKREHNFNTESTNLMERNRTETDNPSDPIVETIGSSS